MTRLGDFQKFSVANFHSKWPKCLATFIMAIFNYVTTFIKFMNIFIIEIFIVFIVI